MIIGDFTPDVVKKLNNHAKDFNDTTNFFKKSKRKNWSKFPHSVVTQGKEMRRTSQVKRLKETSIFSHTLIAETCFVVIVFVAMPQDIDLSSSRLFSSSQDEATAFIR